MRIVLALLMCWGVAFGQDTTKYFKSVDYGWNWQRGKFRGGLILPTDTTNNKLGIAQIGATCFAWSGTKWNSIGSTDTSFLVRYYRKNQVDSAIAANAPALTLQDVTTNGNTTTDSIIATSFKRTGGTSSQFLKANGSIDGNTYLTTAVTAVTATAPLLYTNSTTTPNIIADTGRGNNQLATGGSLNKVKDSLSAIITSISTPTLSQVLTNGNSANNTIQVNQVKAFGSGGLSLNSNGGTQIANLGAGGGSNATFYGFTGYNSNLASSYTTRSFTDKNYVDSSVATKGTGSVTSVATGLGLSGGTITTSGTLLVDTASTSIISRQRAAATYATNTSIIDSIRLVNTGVLHTTPAAYSKSGTTGVVTQTLSNQSAYTLFGRASGTGTPSFLTSIDSLWIPNLRSENYYNTKYLSLSGGTLTSRLTGTSLILNKDSTPTVTGKSWGLIVDTSNSNRISRQLLTNGTVTSITLGRGITGTSPITSTATIGLDTTKGYTWTGFNIYSPSVTATSALARALLLSPTLIAAANSDVLVGLDVSPTYTNGAYTGVANYSIRSGQILVSSGGLSFSPTTGLGINSLTAANLPNSALTFVPEFNYFTVRRTGSSGTMGFKLASYGTDRSFWRYNDGNDNIEFGNQSNAALYLYSNNTARIGLLNSGNVIIQNGGTFTDSGERLQVIGTARTTAQTYLSTTSGVVRVNNTTDAWQGGAYTPTFAVFGTTSARALIHASDNTGGQVGSLAGTSVYSGTSGNFESIYAATNTYTSNTGASPTITTGAGYSYFNRGNGGYYNYLALTSNGTNSKTFNGFGNYFYFQTSGGALNLTGNLYGFRSTANFVDPASSGITVSSLNDIVLENPTFTSGVTTITERIGLNIAFGNTNVTNAWGVYQSNANVKNYFNGGIGLGTSSINASAILDITSTTKGILTPRMTTTQMNAISSPATGLELYNTDAGMKVSYNGTSYKSSGIISNSVSSTLTATTTITVTFSGTQPNSTYKVSVTPTSVLALGGYVTNKTTTTFDYVLPITTGTVTFDYQLTQ